MFINKTQKNKTDAEAMKHFLLYSGYRPTFNQRLIYNKDVISDMGFSCIEQGCGYFFKGLEKIAGYEKLLELNKDGKTFVEFVSIYFKQNIQQELVSKFAPHSKEYKKMWNKVKVEIKLGDALIRSIIENNLKITDNKIQKEFFERTINSAIVLANLPDEKVETEIVWNEKTNMIGIILSPALIDTPTKYSFITGHFRQAIDAINHTDSSHIEFFSKLLDDSKSRSKLIDTFANIFGVGSISSRQMSSPTNGKRHLTDGKIFTTHNYYSSIRLIVNFQTGGLATVPKDNTYYNKMFRYHSG